MKACPQCGRLYPDEGGFCPVDGSALGRATQVPVAVDASDSRIGQLICNRYQVRRVVADGGMGRVYEALDLQTKQNLAVKVLHQDVASDEVAVERFKREFEVSKQLPHDYIVEVYDFQPTSDSTYAIAMEYLYGEELRATLKREGVISPARLVRMLSQIALGLDEAHSRNFVHRDLKPDNLFLCQTSDGDIVKILDFGSVKDKGETAKKLTVLGTTIGSPFYMAPEQAQGLDTLDQRADVWALSAIVYECVTGQVPFYGTNGPSILLEILTKEPRPASEAGKARKYPVPPTLDRVLQKAFKKSPALRTATVGLLADEVGQAYGLSGDHRGWATLPEGQMVQQIDATLPGLMTAPAPAPAKKTSTDDFFGESQALGDSVPPFAAKPAAPSGNAVLASSGTASGAAVRTSDFEAAGIPKRGVPKSLWVSGAVAVGILLVLVVVLLR
ncbi:MAG TPA: serine/threonine-protein kinase [Polyangiaceae bacterium]|nr:serine/threonine-protein kinase [Polyangiaceae bacterium]